MRREYVERRRESVKATAFISVGLAVLWTLSCGQEAPSSVVEQEPVESPAAAAESTSAQVGGLSADSMWSEQKLIRTAEMVMAVASVGGAVEEVELIATRQDALVADAKIEQYGSGGRRALLSVRVPTANFEAALREFREVGEVERENVTTQDVTKAYADLETRLAVKREAERRLRDLLTSRTGDLSEVLQVERELSRLVGEIEQLEGERRYYDRRIAVSTIDLTLWEGPPVFRPGVLAPVGDALSASLSVLASSVGALIYAIVFLVPWVLVVGLVWVTAKKIRGPRPAPGGRKDSQSSGS